MIKWFKQFDDFEEEELPWVINGCIPGDSYLHYIEAQIDKLKQYYDNLLEEVQLMNVTARETFISYWKHMITMKFSRMISRAETI